MKLVFFVGNSFLIKKIQSTTETDEFATANRIRNIQEVTFLQGNTYLLVI